MERKGGAVPIYDVRCRSCGTTFEVNRPMAQVDDPAPCPSGHEDTVRLLPVVTMTGLAKASAVAKVRAGDLPPPVHGGGCGSGCRCAS
jgi:putative FmdB family regulatory protein